MKEYPPYTLSVIGAIFIGLILWVFIQMAKWAH